MNKVPPVKFKQKSGIVIARVATGAIVDARVVSEIGQNLLAYIEAHPGQHMILDLSRIDYISSAVFREIVRVRSALEQTGATLRVCVPSQDLRILFKITNLDSIVHLDTNIKQAMAHFI